jgi:HEAT repeat protein
MTDRRLFLGMSLVGVLVLAMIGEAGDSYLGKSSAEWLKMLREDKSPKRRKVSLLALEAIGVKPAGVTKGLFEALREDPDPEVRQEIAQMLGRIGPDAKGAPEALGERLANDKDERVRQAAATALGGKLAKVADGQVRTLAGALKDKHEGTRRAAAEALKNLGMAAEAALPELIVLAKDSSADRFSRSYALQIISLHGKEDKGTAPALVHALGEKGAHATVRQAAAEGLGRLGGDDPATVTALATALTSAPPEVRRSAAAALGEIGAKAGPAWPAIKTTLEDRKGDSAIRFPLIRTAAVLAKEHADAVPVLAKLAQDDEAAENRLAAIQELGELGPTAAPATPVLQGIAQGEARATLRQAAQLALKKIKGAK